MAAASDRLEWVMRTPARRPVLDTIFWQMPKHLDRTRAAGLSATVRWCITGRRDGGVDIYDLVLDDGHCHATRGRSPGRPRVTITLDGAEFLRLISGSSNALRSYFAGSVSVSGDIVFAAQLASLFRIPNGRPSRRT
jgi:alkyl sulfatase BDS1-like metallo-beta-lactamase superfamily hydrolase